MPGNKDNLKYLYEAIEGYVTFGDGQQAQVKGKWTLNVEGIPNLKEVLYVEGLRVNLVSVSHYVTVNLSDSIDMPIYTQIKIQLSIFKYFISLKLYKCINTWL